MVMGQLTTNADVAVIGAGPGGYTAAIRAAQLGKEVVLIEKGHPGGTCTNLGCIPSKALIHASELMRGAADAKAMGLSDNPSLDFSRTQTWKDGVVKGLRDGIATLCRSNGVELIDGRAFFTSSTALTVETEAGMRAVEFRKAVIATGSEVKGVPNLPYDHKRIIDSDDALSLREVPKRLVVVGGGYIAAEMACMFLRLGSRVTVIHRGDRLLKSMEPELGIELARGIGKLGGELLFNSEVVKIEGENAVVKARQGERRIAFDRMLVAAGRGPCLEGLGIDKTKVKLDHDGLVVVDSTMKTTDDNIYAVGDVVPGPQLAHKAFRQGKVAAECITGMKSSFDNRAMPMVVFAEPVLASVGLTEGEARAKGYQVKAGKVPLAISGRASAMGRKEGFVKVVADGHDVVLGVQAAGEGADALIAEAALAIEMAATLEDLAVTIHAHPTMPESLAEAAEAALGKAIHIYMKR